MCRLRSKKQASNFWTEMAFDFTQNPRGGQERKTMPSNPSTPCAPNSRRQSSTWNASPNHERSSAETRAKSATVLLRWEATHLCPSCVRGLIKHPEIDGRIAEQRNDEQCTYQTDDSATGECTTKSGHPMAVIKCRMRVIRFPL
jgi:hypothetical protein